ncbi:hypothetical protein Sros_9014 [Streptosporangium roseum DSM 43021]|uniref:Uncharacterized protein n=1 Tax=Streptosporangium roseum (strain ATCC 12428 / DSM 43021 / JCM 3005 / KCTC 9067 / NCIMB 10171 / NRRL 2505 / NI 9100) TaxID=479432 RepID=D2B9A0_STRRD|nr:hypothetical protein Sros_9014 [Streptosporangium roseum DSM 43021]
MLKEREDRHPVPRDESARIGGETEHAPRARRPVGDRTGDLSLGSEA